MSVAEKWFGFRRDEKTTVSVGDGRDSESYLQAERRRRHGPGARRRRATFSSPPRLTVFEAVEDSFDAIVVDVDEKDEARGMRCPPAAFVDTAYLEKCRSRLRPAEW